MSYLDELVEKQAKSKGLIWMNILIEFDPVTGKSKILRSFSKPASDSFIKKVESKKKEQGESIKIDTSDVETERLF
jgi:hypothetical protein